MGDCELLTLCVSETVDVRQPVAESEPVIEPERLPVDDTVAQSVGEPEFDRVGEPDAVAQTDTE